MRRRKEGNAPSFGSTSDQFFLVLALFHDHFVQELFLSLAELDLLHRGDLLNGSCGRRKSV
jgi:hypothetical protein